MKNQVYRESERTLPVAGRYDVLVCGGGPAGFMAAVAAARQGMRTLLIERYGFLGGTATAAMMVEFGSIFDGKTVLIGGIPHELLHRLEQYGGAELLDPQSHRMIFDPESLIAVCQEMAMEAGVELRLHTLVVDAIRTDNTVQGVITESKSGREAVTAEVVIDATGDADVAARAGADYCAGREQDGKMQPATLEILLGNVDAAKVPERHHALIPKIQEAKARGEWTLPTDQLFSWGRVKKRGAPDIPEQSFFFINGTNALGVDGTSAPSLTQAEIETRRQVEALVNFLRKYAPGFENCYLDRTAAQVGIRETRRIVGDYTLTREDVLGARHFPDGVVPACNSLDVHDVAGRRFQLEFLQPGTHYEIPFRCFLPAGLEGLLVAGRCISADHAALGSVRVMVVCMPMGEACGLAAALSVKNKCRPRDIPVAELRAALRRGGTKV